MAPRLEIPAFALALAALIGAFLGDSLVGGKVLSPADVLRAQASFRGPLGSSFEPSNRLLIDPVLQFQPWLEFNRSMLRTGRLPLWNPLSGCGAPHLANGQAAVFDPFHAIAYLGRLPDAYAWMAFARLWVAGLGAFLLSKSWGVGPWGRWFSGLTFPLCGFLVLWLQFPVTSAAVWLPWIVLATDRVLRSPTPRSIAALALGSGATLLGGHVQTSAHVLLFDGIYALWSIARLRGSNRPPRFLAWAAGVALGVMLASIEVLPLAGYLSRSPVWADRAASKPPALAIERPRLLDAACTALPYLFGSQRRGHPNLAKGLGVHNLNESAGGFAGLATLLWLAPIGVASGDHRARFLAVLGGFGALAAFAIPPAPNLLRLIPVLDVADNRRLTLWVAFSLTILGGFGIDRVAIARPGRIRGASMIAGAFILIASAALIARSGPILAARADRHYARAAAETPGADPSEYRDRAARQVDRATRFLPSYLGLAAAELLILGAIAEGLRRGAIAGPAAKSTLLGLTIAELFLFGYGLNPAIAPPEHRPDSPVIDYLRREASPPSRILAIGAELPPNLLMRYGLADVRNYDSVELSTGLDRLAPLFDPSPGRSAPRSSRRTISWAGVLRSPSILDAMRVSAVVSATPPPAGSFRRIDRVGDVWVARRPIAPGPLARRDRPGEIEITLNPDGPRILAISETFDPGWSARFEGRPLPVGSTREGMLKVRLPAGPGRLILRYRPIEVTIGAALSLVAIGGLSLLIRLSDSRPTRGKSPGRAWMARKGRVRINRLDPQPAVLAGPPGH